MADDQSQRPYRASEPPPSRGAAKTGSDPLAELARLIGQTDPFGEYGRETARRSPPSQSIARTDWNQPLGTSYTAQYSGDARPPEPSSRYAGDGYHVPSAPARPRIPEEYGSQDYERQPYEAEPPVGAPDHYEAEQESHRFPLDQSDRQQDFYDEAPVEDEYYEDAPRSRRRMVVMAIAGVAALAVIGTAGAFGYRAFVGSSGSTKPPPVIKADTAPSKIVPATTGKDTQSNKLITDRVNERGQSEKLVSREEQPLDRPTAVALSQSGPQATLGSGVVGSEPKKVRTIAIHPDQPVADAAPTSMSAAVAAPAKPTPAPAPRATAAPARPAPDTTADAEESVPATPTRAAQPPRQAAPASGSAPLSLNPNAAPSRAAPAPAPARTASVAPQAPAAAATGGGAGSYVQVSSQRNESDAQAAFRSLQAKFPSQLGGRQPYIHKVDLGAKGTYYRAMVGPFANASEASQLCSSLKAAGGQCLVQRN